MLSPLDREKKDHYILTALAKDNPGDIASNRRENSVQVRELLMDQGHKALWLWRQQAKSLENGYCRVGGEPPIPLRGMVTGRRRQELSWDFMLAVA